MNELTLTKMKQMKLYGMVHLRLLLKPEKLTIIPSISLYL